MDATATAPAQERLLARSWISNSIVWLLGKASRKNEPDRPSLFDAHAQAASSEI
jgi:hypothetical protein